MGGGGRKGNDILTVKRSVEASQQQEINLIFEAAPKVNIRYTKTDAMRDAKRN